MEKISKKYNLILGMIICIVIGVILLSIIILLLQKYQESKIIFERAQESWASGHHVWGYTIDSDGILTRYDSNNENIALKKYKLTDEELKKLKEYANKIEDIYEEKDSLFTTFDGGATTYKIYSNRLSKWVKVYYESATRSGRNLSEVAEEVIKFQDEIYKKYVK